MSAVMPCEFGGIVATSTPRYAVEIGSTQSPRCAAMSSAVITPPASWIARAISVADRTAVVGVAAAVGDRAQRRREEWLAEGRARSAGRREDGARGRR